MMMIYDNLWTFVLFYAQFIVTGIDTRVTTAVIYFVCIFYSALVTSVSIYLNTHTYKSLREEYFLGGRERLWKATWCLDRDLNAVVNIIVVILSIVVMAPAV